jgi:phytoene/squalene synthetase
MSLRLPQRDASRALTDGDRYDRVAQAAAARVIRGYSTSFGLACALLRQPVRDHVRNVYALVRLADEVVDGPLAIQDPDRADVLLGRLEQEAVEALREGDSANLVVHAFALTARSCGIGTDLVAPFFASMRADLTVREHDPQSFERYVYGSAEVVGLMCLKAFLADPSGRSSAGLAGYDELAPGARRLGAAFQKVNFLRDLAADHGLRGRRYFPGIDPERLSEADKHRLLDDVDRDLAAAAAAVRHLPRSSRPAVAVAHGLFTELSRRLRATPVEQIMTERTRVPADAKARVALLAAARASWR